MKRIVLVSLFLLSPFVSANEGMMISKGFGTVDSQKFPQEFQAKMMAKRAAQVDAQRQLAEMIRGIRLTGGTTVEDYEVQSDIVATRVKGMLQGAFVLNEKVEKESGSFVAEVEMAVCADDSDPKCKGKFTLAQLKEVAEKQ